MQVQSCESCYCWFALVGVGTHAWKHAAHLQPLAVAAQEVLHLAQKLSSRRSPA